MFKKKSALPSQQYDAASYKAIVKCSICNGEQVAGFKNLHTGKFEEIMLVRSEADLKEFKERYGITEITKEY